MKGNLKDLDLVKRIDYTPVAVTKHEVYPYNKKSPIRQCDDEILTFNFSSRNYIYIFIGLINFCILGLSPEGKAFYGWFVVFLVYGIKFFCLYLALLGLLGYRNKKVTLNRLKGTITYPAFGWFGSITKPFDQTVFFLTQVGPYGNAGERLLAILRPDGWTRSVINARQIDKFFSLYVWYMDRNRPLPPGSAFDAYRKKDYERRKSEGFPAPLYPSSLNIVEEEGSVKIIYSPKPLTLAEKYLQEQKKKKQHKIAENISSVEEKSECKLLQEKRIKREYNRHDKNKVEKLEFKKKKSS